MLFSTGLILFVCGMLMNIAAGPLPPNHTFKWSDWHLWVILGWMSGLVLMSISLCVLAWKYLP